MHVPVASRSSCDRLSLYAESQNIYAIRPIGSSFFYWLAFDPGGSFGWFYSLSCFYRLAFDPDGSFGWFYLLCWFYR